MKISFDCYATARLRRVSDVPMGAEQLRAAGLDGFDDPEVEIAVYLDEPLIADEGLIDDGVRYWLDAQGDLHATLSFRCIPQLSASQIEAMSNGLVGQLKDGWGSGRLLDTPSGEVWIEWFEHGKNSDATFDVKQVDDGEPVPDNRTPASLKAAEHGDLARLRAALDAGCSPDIRGVWDMTALMLATREGHEACVDLLLERGADVNIVSSENGGTALTHAAMTGRAAIARKLLVAGADCSLGKSPPLHWAAARDHEDVVRVILEAGVDPMMLNDDGETALFGTNNLAIINLLVKSGVDINFRSRRGKTALDDAIAAAESWERFNMPEFVQDWLAAAAELRSLG